MLLSLLTACSWLGLGPSEPPPPIEVYLVRHAEKDTSVEEDPPLTPAGEARAEALAERLADVELVSVHSTDTLRTRSTAAPIARKQQLPLQLYDGREPDALIAQLKTTPGVHLVVGHSNTVPDLVGRLGGEPGAPIDEKREYDRLMHVVLPAPDTEGEVQTKLDRYGAPMQPEPPTVTAPETPQD